MIKVRMPEVVRGEWIWRSIARDEDDVFMIARKTFEADSLSLDNTFWVTANAAYALYINERFCGFGPRAGQGEAACVDMYDVSGYLQSGVNVVVLVVYASRIPGDSLPHGFWCQLEDAGEILMVSDASWDFLEGRGLAQPRPRTGKNQLMTEYCDNTLLPERLFELMYQPDIFWAKPDQLRKAGHRKEVELSIYPLPPGTIDSLVDFTPLDHGTLKECCAWSQVLFGDRHRNRRAACAAECHIFSETDKELPVRLYADDPFRLFCNNRLVRGGGRSDGEELSVLALRAGWNRLLAVMEPGRNSMGLFLLFPDRAPGSVMIYQQPDESSPPFWTVAGPLKMPLRDATASLVFDNLETEACVPRPGEPVDMSSVLKHSEFEAIGAGGPATLRTGEFARYRLDMLRYGFPVLVFEAEEGDLVDITFGYQLAPNGLPCRGELLRATHTLRCRRGQNRFMFFNPREGLYLMISARQAAKEVRIVSCGFEELLRLTGSETDFECSDDEFNTLWRIGMQTMRRSSAFVPQIESHAEYDNYLLDAYIDAVNMVAGMGAHDYSAARLRQFIDVQFENGDIPVLTFAKRYRSQVHHLFFLPVWMLYNYRVSGDIGELRALSSPLERLWRFFRSLVDEESGMIGEIKQRFNLASPISPNDFGLDCIPTYVNALYCRFLLSAAEIFRAVGRKTMADDAIDEAQNLSERLYRCNFDEEKRLFVCSSRVRDGEAEQSGRYNLFANFATLLSGVMPREDLDYFLDYFFNPEPPFDKSAEAASPYFHFLFLEIMFAIGRGAWAKRYFREYWRRRVSSDSATWLTWRDTGSPAPLRFYDGNVISPNAFLVREIAGIRIAASGHTAIYFNPAPDQVDWVKLSLPTVFGKVKVRWEKQPDGSLSVMIDANYPVKVLPEMSQEQLSNTSFELGVNVVLLAPPEKEAEEA